MRRVSRRILPFLILCYLGAFINRGNLGMAALQMNQDLGLSPAMFSLAGSLFFIAYFLFEVPSNLLMQRFGARRWLARIMISWGLVAMGTAFVRDMGALCAMRFLLGAAEAGFFPGVILYLGNWFPAAYQARIIGMFMAAIPASAFLSSPLSALLLQMDGAAGLRGWQWLFLAEGLLPLLLGCSCLFLLADSAQQARWLPQDQRAWLAQRIARESRMRAGIRHESLARLLREPRLWRLALICSAASASGTVLNLWQPQILKSFGASVMQTGLLNAAPYAVATVVMVLWGRHSDRSLERRWHTAIPLLLCGAGLCLSLLARAPGGIYAGLCMTLIGSYAFKGPFWAMTSGCLSGRAAAAGIAGVNAVSNLVGGGLILNLSGWLREQRGDGLALAPLALLCGLGILALLSLRTGVAQPRPGPADEAL
ncbi:MFS transporter [Noviherbaspirillum pedocola]|nr:MFS transporter [Noviherbaspirillum pedocola]